MGILRERQIAFKVTVQERQLILRVARAMNMVPSKAIRHIILSSDISKEISEKYTQKKLNKKVEKK